MVPLHKIETFRVARDFFGPLKVLSNGAGGGWRVSCRQVSVFGPKGTPSREEHKTHGRVLTTFSVVLTNWCRKIRQNVSP
jgi:hypothetical protein